MLTLLQPFNLDSTKDYTFANATLGNVATANYYVGNGSLLSGVAASSSNIAATVTTNAQPNITSTGTLSSLTVSGLITATGTGIKTANIQDSTGTITITTKYNNVAGDVGIYGNLTVGTSGTGNVTTPQLTVTGSSTISDIRLTGDIIPDTANTRSLGNVTNYFKDAYIGPGSLYIDGQKVMQSVANTIVVSADVNQSVKVSTSGSGDVILDPTGTGLIQVKGPLQVEAGTNITSSDGNAIHFANPINVDSISAHQANTDLILTGSGTGIVKVNDDFSITGNLIVDGTTSNLSVSGLSVQDNIIDINAEAIGAPTANAGIRVIRGDEPATQLRWAESLLKWQYTVDGTNYANIVGADTSGNISLGNVAIANYFIGNGSQLTGLPAGYSNSNVAAYLPTYTGNVSANYFIGNGSQLTSIPGANVTGAVAYATTANSVAVANISGIGNIATINQDGNSGNVLYGNGIFAAAPAGGGGGTSTMFMVAVTDETSNLTVSSARMSFRAPTAMTLSNIPRASLSGASSSGSVICDIKLNGTTILGANKLSIDATELTSTTAATPTTLVTTSIPDDGLFTVDITSAGVGAKGLKITLYT